MQHTDNSLKPSTDNSIAEHALLEVSVEVVKQKSCKFFYGLSLTCLHLSRTTLWMCGL